MTGKPQHQTANQPTNEFERVGQQRELTFVEEFLVFIRQNQKWWLVPIFIVLALLGVLAALGSSGAAPFIYTAL